MDMLLQKGDQRGENIAPRERHQDWETRNPRQLKTKARKSDGDQEL